MAVTFLIVFLILGITAIAARLLLELLNIKYVKSRAGKVPELVSDVINPEDLKKATGYFATNSSFGIIHYLFDKTILLIFLFSGLLAGYTALFGGVPFVPAGLLFFGILFVVSAVIELPFSYYSHFVIEEKFGFNTQTVRNWLIDSAKELLVGMIMGGFLLAAILLLIRYLPNIWWLIAWGVSLSFSVFMLIIYPVLIAPLFNKFTPVEGALAEKLIRLSEKAGISVSGVFEMDASKRSKHTNAYFTGIGRTKRIVLFDTLIKNHSGEEIEAVLAHEIGHWKKMHIIKSVVISQIISLIGFFLAGYFLDKPYFYQAFGVPELGYAGLMIFSAVIGFTGIFLKPLLTAMSRKFEREADAFACSFGLGPYLIITLKKLVRDNLSVLEPHPLYVRCFYSHPPILERIKLINKY